MDSMENLWELPDPFLKPSGKRVECVQEWESQREYLKEILTHWLYGQMPPPPGNVQAMVKKQEELWGGYGIQEELLISCGPSEKIRFRAYVIRKNDGKDQMPVVVPFYVEDEVVKPALEDGFCIVIFNPEDGAPDGYDYTNGSCYQAYPKYSWKVIAMWAWMQSRVIDFLENQPYVRADQVIVAGHSRYGKTALCCAVYDERVALCAAAGSGCGGMSCLRHVGSRMGENTGFYETTGWLMREHGAGYWFQDRFGMYGEKEIPCRLKEEYRLPFDSHFIPAVIAPRPFMLLEGLDDFWCNPYGTQISWMAGAEVYRFLGAEKNCGLHYREGGHRFGNEDWQILREFARTVFKDAKKERSYKTMETIEAKKGYSWRCPGEKDADIQDFFAQPMPKKEYRWHF